MIFSNRYGLSLKAVLHRLPATRAFASGFLIKSLRDACRDFPSAPTSPNEPPAERKHQLPTLEAQWNDASLSDYPDPAAQARTKLTSLGYDSRLFWEQRIVWGHQDAFRHVNNAQYFRFFEAGRVQWILEVGNLLGGKERAQAMLSGQGISIILKSINVNYRRPVTFPDTLLVGHKTIVTQSRTEFIMAAVAYSYTQQAVVADSEGVLVWYDYDKLKRCDPGAETWKVLKEEMASEVRDGGQASSGDSKGH